MNKQRQRGMTLIELMVALTIGLLITLVVTEVYLSGLGTQQTQSNLARAQEASRFAFDLIDRSLKKAGFKNPRGPWNGFCSGTVLNRLAMSNDVSGNDEITIRYYSEGQPTSPYASDGSITDCLGNAHTTDILIEDRFYIADDPDNDNEPALFCSTSQYLAGSSTATSTVAAALVPGIESMQMLYGEDTAVAPLPVNGEIDRYIPATSATVPVPNNVRSVMVSLIARTKERDAVAPSTQNINHFGTSSGVGTVFAAPADGKIRQHTVATFALRNLCML